MINEEIVTLDPFRTVNRTFPKTKEILEFKQEGKKVFGWLCTYVPEEIIHAAGALPLRITGYSEEKELDDIFCRAAEILYNIERKGEQK